MMQISFGVSNSTVLMKPCAETPGHGGGEEGDENAQHEALRRRARTAGRRRSSHSRAGIDAEDRQDRAELDQDLEGLAGRLEAEKVPGKQNVPGRRDRDELGEAFQQAEQQGFGDRLVFHSRLLVLGEPHCLSWRGTPPIGRAPWRPAEAGAAMYRRGRPETRRLLEIPLPGTMLTLFHHPMFAACRFVRLAFGEYGEELALIEEKPWTRRKEFLALNPAGTLPVLLAEGDVPIIGAPVIAEYLDETRGVLKRDRRLLAEDPMDRAEIRRLADWYLVKIGERGDPASGARARAEAADARGAGRRLARFGGHPRRARQHPAAHEIHQLAGRHPPLAGRAAGSPMPISRLRRRCRSSTISARSTGATTPRRANGMRG